MEKVLGTYDCGWSLYRFTNGKKRVCDFILPALFKLERLQSARLLIKHVANLKADNTKGLSDEDCIWSMMEIINAARRGGVSRGTSVSPNYAVDTNALGHTSEDETLQLPKSTIAVALKSADKNLFLSALELICCSKETKAPITDRNGVAHESFSVFD